MRQPFYFEGPWKGVNADAQDPRVYFSDVLNAEFPYGVAKQRSFLRVLGNPLSQSLADLLAVIYVKHREGMDKFVFVTRDKLYVGDGSGRILVDCTANSGWFAMSPSDISWAHVVTDASEWIVLTARELGKLVRMEASSRRFEPFVVPVGGDSSTIRGGRVLTVFGDRLVFGSVLTPISEIPHAVGWFGIKGPFDYTLPTSGYMPLTDIPGPVRAFAHVQDFLAVFKDQGAYLLQKTFLPEVPFAAIPRLHRVGVSKPGHVVPVLQQSALVLYSEATKRVYVWDLNKIEDVSQPVWRDLEQREDPLLSYNENEGTVDVSYEDMVLRFSLKDGWWSKESPWWPYYPLPAYVERMGITIDELEGTIDEQPGRINDYPAAVVSGKRCYAGIGGFVREDPDASGTTVWRTVPLRFPKPVTITMFEAHLRAPLNAIVSMRYSLDEGTSWSQYVTLERGDLPYNAYTHHFVETSRSFIFEVMVEGSKVELVRWGVDVVQASYREDEVPYGSAVGSSGVW